MPQSVYSVYGSKMQLILEDSFAEAYNRAADGFSEAATRQEKLLGPTWFEQPFWCNWTEEEKKAFNDFAELMNLLVEINNGGIEHLADEQGEVPSLYLVKLES